MKKNKLILALSLSMALASCSDSDNNGQSAVDSAAKSIVSQIVPTSTIMDYIPAQTPLLMVYAQDPSHPFPDNLKQKMEKVYDSLGEFFKMTITEQINKEADENKKADMQAFVDKWMTEDSLEKLGMSLDEFEMAIYAVDLFPVLRMTLAKSHAMDEILDEIMLKVNEDKNSTAIKRDVDGKTVYQLGDKEFQLMISLDDNKLAASFAPTREVDALMSKLLGFEKPAENLKQSSQFSDTIDKYGYMSNSLYWVNFRDIADYIVNPANYDTAMLDVMKIQENMFSDDCKTEVLAMVDKAPRIVGGNRSISNNEMTSHMIIEMEDGLGSKMATMTGRIPKASGNPAITYGLSFDIAAAKKLAQEFVTNIETTPYKCEFFTKMNTQAGVIQAQLSQPLPPFVSNFKGMNMVIDELDIDFSQKDPAQMIKTVKANMLLAVDNPEALKGMAEMMLPELQKLGVVAGGDAVNISSLVPISGSQIPVNLDHLFFAMGDETMGVSLGEGTEVVLKDSVSQDATSELFNMKITSEIYKDLFSGMAEVSNNLQTQQPMELSFQKLMNNDLLWWDAETIGMKFSDNGLEIDMLVEY